VFSFLTLALDCKNWLASYPAHFCHGETAPTTHWIMGSVGPTDDMDVTGKRNIRESNHDSLVIQSVA